MPSDASDTPIDARQVPIDAKSSRKAPRASTNAARAARGSAEEGTIEPTAVTIDEETRASAAPPRTSDALGSPSKAQATRIDDEILCGASQRAPIEAHEVTRDRLGSAIAARDMTRASLGLPIASLEVMDRCQSVPRAPRPETSAARSDIFGAISTPCAPIFERSASQETSSAALVGTRASIVTTRASVDTTREARGVPIGGARGTLSGSRRGESVPRRAVSVAGGSGRVDRGAERGDRCSSGGDRQTERLDRRTESGSRARFAAPGVSCGGTVVWKSADIRDLQTWGRGRRVCRPA